MTALQVVRSRPGVTAGLLAAAGLAWWWTIGRMAGMDAGPGTDLGPLGWFTATWVAMMAAMMLPSFAPVLAGSPALAPGRGPSRSLLCTAGYLLAWTAAGVAAYGLFEVGKDLVGSDLAWSGGGRWLSAGVIVLAVVYQLTPIKRACLMRCRGQLKARAVSESDRSAALVTGARSGVWCIGCSWALMAALFALGVMSLIWMALIAGLVAFEKIGPNPAGARLATAVVLAALAVGVLVAPGQVPGLVVPGSGGMHAMSAMGQ